MGKNILAVIMLTIGAFIAFLIPSDIAKASYSNSGYYSVIIIIGISVLFFYFGDKIAKFRTKRPLGLAIFLPGIFNVFISLATYLLDDSAKRLLKPGVLELSKNTLIYAIILCVIGFLFFILKEVFKANNASIVPEKLSSDKDLPFQKSPSFLSDSDQQAIIKLYNELKQKYGTYWSEKGIILKIKEELSFDQELIKDTLDRNNNQGKA
jgi:hypothetical protein